MKDDNDVSSIYNALFMLLLILIIFVIGDTITTSWLIYNDPSGLSNESNQFAILLYSKYGIGGLLLAKMMFFLPFSTLTIIAESKYHKIKWFHHSTEIILISLIAYSLVIFLNNLIAIIIISAFKGLLSLLQLLPVMNIFIIVLSVTVGAILILYDSNFKHA